MINRYEVGYEDEMIGVYLGETPDDAINECRSEMRQRNFTSATPARERMRGMIANKV